jgi:hypothetical protein
LLFSNNKLFEYSIIEKKLKYFKLIHSFKIIVADGSWRDIKLGSVDIYDNYILYTNKQHHDTICFRKEI